MKWDQSEILFQKMYSNSGDKIYIGLFVDQKKICLKQKGNWKAKRTCSPEAGLAWGLAESWKNVSRSCLSLSVLLHFFLNSLLRQEVYRLAHRKPKSRMKETRFLSLTLPTCSRLSSDHSKMKGPHPSDQYVSSYKVFEDMSRLRTWTREIILDYLGGPQMQ